MLSGLATVAREADAGVIEVAELPRVSLCHSIVVARENAKIHVHSVVLNRGILPVLSQHTRPQLFDLRYRIQEHGGADHNLQLSGCDDAIVCTTLVRPHLLRDVRPPLLLFRSVQWCVAGWGAVVMVGWVVVEMHDFEFHLVAFNRMPFEQV